MFSFFKCTSPSIKVIDKVWMTKQAKLNACSNMLSVNVDILFVCWFEETLQELQKALSLKGNNFNLLLAEKITTEDCRGKMVVFAEHYPLMQAEQDLFSKLNQNDVPVLSSLDEPIFKNFGGDKIAEVMKSMGMKEDEVIGHTMVSKSIQRAQKALAKNFSAEGKALSQKEWFAINTNNF